jgi:hypothetical protein
MYKRVCADWLPQTCGRTEAVSNKITRGNINEYNLLKQLQHNSLLTKYIVDQRLIFKVNPRPSTV